MKRVFFPFILLLFFINPLTSQNNRLIGLITYQNTGVPVDGVSITPTEGANPTKSNDTGQFQLDFAGKLPGDIVKMILTKDQYRVAGLDPMIVEVALRQEAGDLVRIVMVRKGEYNQREDKYVKAIEKQLEEKDKEIQFYRSQLTENKLTDEERRGLTQQIGELTQALERLDKNKEELAKRLVQVDLDQASFFAREALEEFETGSLEKALALMDDEKLDDFWVNILEQEETVKRAKEQGIENYMIKARLLSADGKVKEAYKNFLKAIERDSTNVNNLYELAYFCGKINQQGRAINFYQQALLYNKSESQKALLLHNLGGEFQNNNQYEQTESVYKEALEITRRLAKDNPERFEPYVASTQNNLGLMYVDLNAYEQAESTFKEALKIRKRLAKENPERFEPDVASTQNNLGLMYDNLNAHEQAEGAFKEALKITRRLAKENPERFEPDVARTQDNLGLMYINLNAYEQAEDAFKEALEIRRRLAKESPERFEPDVASTQNKLGIMYRNLNAYEQAESAFKQALYIRKHLAKDNPERFELDVAMTQNNLGNLYQNQHAYEQAASSYKEALEITKRLAKDNRERFEPYVAAIQNNLGLIYQNLDAYEQAEGTYKQALEIYQRLTKDNPERFEPDVAMIQNNLGNIYQNLNAYEQAEDAFKQALEIRKRLAKNNPERFEPYVANTQNNLANVYADLNAYEQAEGAYKQALETYQRLAKNNPERFDWYVAGIQNNLGEMYAEQKAYEQAEGTYKQALKIYQRLAKDDSKSYNLYLANTVINIGYLHKALLEQYLDLAYQSSGFKYAKQAEATLSLYSTDIPIIKRYNYRTAELISYFENITVEDLHIQARINKVLPLEEKNRTEADPAKKVANQVKVVGILENVWQQYSENASIIPTLSKAYSSLAWHQLFNRHFVEAEQAANKGLEIDPSQEWINTNLALALLYQGKYKEAKEIYLKLKDKPYGAATYSKAFLEDLNALGQEGIIHPDVKKIRELLHK